MSASTQPRGQKSPYNVGQRSQTGSENIKVPQTRSNSRRPGATIDRYTGRPMPNSEVLYLYESGEEDLMAEVGAAMS
eukprot:CAMPEP_0198216334 /NCGR_PEP_ID=MMETSP1445-20131203/56750_1 /TAXON_ID=36898 /ORGANISM="Pyramimonas sp., Strain CCMP2087" /LENGTH=76 /DNA_ID=CAMNT_0043892511 /DNA_START=151 /DNA_END=377 /DNA_ORIENTATION=-